MEHGGGIERGSERSPEGLDLPGPSRRIRVEPLRPPEPVRRDEPPPERLPDPPPEREREPAPEQPARREREPA